MKVHSYLGLFQRTQGICGREGPRDLKFSVDVSLDGDLGLFSMPETPSPPTPLATDFEGSMMIVVNSLSSPSRQFFSSPIPLHLRMWCVAVFPLRVSLLRKHCGNA